MRRAWIPVLLLILGGTAFAQNDNLGTESQRALGRKIYDQKCAQCHGEKGDGQGIAKDHFLPKPRDFTRGLFKIRTTPSGELPTHEDLKRVIKNGMPYTGMPAWHKLTNEELDAVSDYLKTFSGGFDQPVEPIKIGKVPGFSKESAEKGVEIYLQNKCADCHGKSGRGNGKSAPTLTNDWGDPIRPADLTKRWTFRGGSKREDIYRTFTTGLNGTPMPSYADLIQEEDRWHLVDYVYSLSRDEPEYSTLVIAVPVEGDIDLGRGKALFEPAPPAFFSTLGQVIEPERNFFPSSNAIEVKAIYDEDDIALILTWNDMSADTTGLPNRLIASAARDTSGMASPPDTTNSNQAIAPGGARQKFTDAVAIQTPSADVKGVVKPYFLFGDAKNPIDIWYADLGTKQGELVVGRGSQTLEPSGQPIPVSWTYQDGQWNVIMKRPRIHEGGLSFNAGVFVPIAFSIWDGQNSEHGNRRTVTAWYHLYLKPAHVESKAAPMAGYAGLVLLLELAIIGTVRKRSGRPVPAYLSWSKGMDTAAHMNVDLGFSLLGGLVATIAMTIFLYFVMPTLRHSPLDLGALIGDMLDVGWAAGIAIHFLLGALLFPVIFVAFIYPRLPGRPWLKGLLWGAMLWVVAEAIAIPIAHGGFFHVAAGGTRAALGFLIGHLLYGVVLGAVTGSSGPEDLEDLA